MCSSCSKSWGVHGRTCRQCSQFQRLVASLILRSCRTLTNTLVSWYGRAQASRLSVLYSWMWKLQHNTTHFILRRRLHTFKGSIRPGILYHSKNKTSLWKIKTCFAAKILILNVFKMSKHEEYKHTQLQYQYFMFTEQTAGFRYLPSKLAYLNSGQDKKKKIWSIVIFFIFDWSNTDF